MDSKKKKTSRNIRQTIDKLYLEGGITKDVLLFYPINTDGLHEHRLHVQSGN